MCNQLKKKHIFTSYSVRTFSGLDNTLYAFNKKKAYFDQFFLDMGMLHQKKNMKYLLVNKSQIFH